jgi:pimeloyl-ACP methyl ester carboxylesterase
MSTQTSSGTRHATSADGTEIAYEVNGDGPALVVVEGALCTRTMGTAKGLLPSLREHYAVHSYDRRGRGDSGPGASPYAVQREVEDLVAVCEAAGGNPLVLGASSGGVLALEAARQGVPIRSLVVYEAPFILDATHAPNDPDLGHRIRALVADGRRGDAVKTFLRTVGVPAPMLVLMPLLPVWKQLTSVSHTLGDDLELVLPFEQGEPLPAGYYDAVAVPTVVIAGGKSPEYLRNAQAAVADAIPGGRLVTLPGQTHMVKAKATTPVLLEHFGS